MGILRDTFDMLCCMKIDNSVNRRLPDDNVPQPKSKLWLIISLLIAVVLLSLLLLS
jgi:hypothetical protein